MSLRFFRTPASSLVAATCLFLALSLPARAQIPPYDIAIEADSATPDPVAPGENITYTFTVRHLSGYTPDVTITDGLPPTTTFVSLTTPDGWSATTPAGGATGTVTISTATLASGSSATFTLVVRASPGLADGSLIANTVALSTALDADINPTNDSILFQTNVDVPPDITPPAVVSILRKAIPGSVPAASTTASSVVFRVAFSEEVSGVDVSDFALTTAVTATGSIASVDFVAPGIYDVTVDDLAGGGPVRLDLKSTASIADLANNAIGTDGYTLGQRYTHFDTTTPILWGGPPHGNGSLDSIAYTPVNLLPTGALAGKTITELASTPVHTTALTSDGTLYSWGYGLNGLIGDNTTTDRPSPVAVNTDAGTSSLAGKTVVAIAAGQFHMLALASDGSVHAWGLNSSGQLGDGTDTTRLAPIRVGSALTEKTVVAIAAGGAFSLALTSDGILYSWGSNNGGQLGTGLVSSENTPTLVDMTGVLAGKTVTALACGGYHALVLTSDGLVYAWGNGGANGDGTSLQRFSPVAVSTAGVLAGKRVIAIDADDFNSIALTSDGLVFTWGNNAYGQLGNDIAADSNIPVTVSTAGALAGKTIVDIAATYFQSYALSSDGLVYAWGLNSVGQLGDGTATGRTVPTAVNTSGRLAGRTVAAIGRGTTQRGTVLMNGTFPPPTITSTATANGTVGTSFSFSIAATESPQSYSITGTLPTGLVFNATTGVISGTSTLAGTYNITINATNYGGTTSASLTLTIAKGTQTIDFPVPADRVAGAPPLGLVAARFNAPVRAARDSNGNLYVVDALNHTIRKITPTGLVSTFAGTAGSFGTADGTGAAARFRQPIGIVIDSAGNLFVADQLNHTIRKITPAGVVSTFAGMAGAVGTDNGTGSAARFAAPVGLSIDSSDILYVSEFNAHTVRKITPAGEVTTFAGTGGSAGNADGTGAAARFWSPSALTVDTSGNVFVSDTGNHTIRKITPAGEVSTLAGTAGSFGSADGTGSAARFNIPRDVAVDAAGNLYVADSSNSTIRKITPTGVVTTLAGTAGSIGSADGTGGVARFNFPYGILAADSDTLYVLDTFNHAIRRLTPNGVATTVVGVPGFSGNTDGVPALATTSSGLATTYTVVSGPATIADGQLSFTGAGTVVLRASQPGNDNWNAATDVDVTFNVTAQSAAVTLTASSLTHTYDGTPKSAAATTDPSGLTVTITYGGSTTAPTDAGTYDVVATISDNTYAGTTSATLTINKAAQTITFSPLAATSPGSTLPLTATASSGLPVTFSVTSGSAAINGSTLVVNGAGSLTVRATQAGNDNFDSAFAEQTITSTPLTAPQTIDFASPADNSTNSAPFTLSASSSSGLPVTFTVVSGPAMIVDNVLTLTGAAGTVVIKASQAGGPGYDAATDVIRTFQVNAADARVYFGDFFSSSASSVAASRGASALAAVAKVGDVAAVLPAQSNSGSLLVVAPSAGINAVIPFTLQSDSTYTATATQVLTGQTPAERTITVRGQLVNNVLSGTFDDVGLSFTTSVEPRNGPSASAAGLYRSTALRTASAAIYTAVGTNNNALVLVITPTLTAGGLATLDSDNSLDLEVTAPGGGTVTLLASLDPVTTTVSGSLVLPSGGLDFAGLKTTTTRTDRLIGLASRGAVGAGEKVLISGFVVNGPGPKPVLIRAIGPSLAPFGVQGALANPRIYIFREGQLIAENDDWGSATDAANLPAIAARIGAAAVPAGSKDSMFVANLEPGPYTAHVVGGEGVALAEIYDASENPQSEYQRLVGIATRAHVGTGENILIGGFIITGNSPKRVLVRGVGPGLSSHGVASPLADPILRVYAGQQLLAQNDDWSANASTASQITAAETATGAVHLASGSKDAALLLTLAPGLYTIHVAGVNATTGIALAEIYEVPE